jgi:hypothetical protein
MARLWLILWVVMAFGSSGCLITDTPEYKAPRRTALLVNFDPQPYEIIVIPKEPGSPDDSNTYVQTKKIHFDIRSSDVQQVFGLCLIDFPGPKQHPLWFLSSEPGKLDTPGECDLRVPPSISQGCHSITALVSHDRSIINSPRIIEDLGQATWWAQIGINEGASPIEYFPCEPNPISRDAGADARDGGSAL